jgi:hypothetical protein
MLLEQDGQLTTTGQEGLGRLLGQEDQLETTGLRRSFVIVLESGLKEHHSCLVEVEDHGKH